MKRWRSTGWIAVVASFLMVVGCSDSTSGPDPDTPFPHVMPSPNSMQIDTSDLSGGTRAERGLCHLLSAGVVGWVNLNVVVRLAVPILAFNVCIVQQPVFIGNDTWRWTATGGVGVGAWTAELEGTVVSGTQVQWAMRISGTAQGYDRLLWFDGMSDVAANQGYWTYYDPQVPATPTPLVRCDWDLPVATGEDRTVTFENQDAASLELGDTLTYELAGTSASVSHTDVDVGTATIAWDTVTGAGTTTPANGDPPCCWGDRPTYPDVTCPTP